MLSGIASCASLLVSDARRTVSNACEKSNEKTWTKSLSASIERTVCNIAKWPERESVAEVERLTRLWSYDLVALYKYAYYYYYYYYYSAGYMNYRTTNFSSNRDRTSVIEIGRNSLGSAGVAILGISVNMTAVFHWRGTALVVSDWWNRRASGAAKTGVPRRRNHAGIWSIPVAVGRSVSSIQNMHISVT